MDTSNIKLPTVCIQIINSGGVLTNTFILLIVQERLNPAPVT